MQDFPSRLNAELWADVPCCICFGDIADTDSIVEFNELPAHMDCYYDLENGPTIKVYGPLDEL